MMRPLFCVFLTTFAFLGGCQTTSQPFEIGDGKYRLGYFGEIFKNSAIQSARSFCVRKGQRFELGFEDPWDKEINFWCLKEGESVGPVSSNLPQPRVCSRVADTVVCM